MNKMVIVVAVLALGITGCASEGSAPDRAAQAYLRALGDGNSNKACLMMVSMDNQPAKKGSPQYELCRTYLTQWISRTPQLKNLKKVKVTGATLNGEHAVVREGDMTGVYDPPVSSVVLTRIDKTWYVMPADSGP